MDIDYNSQRQPLVLGEHGRHVQEMVRHMLRIEDRAERNKAAETLVRVMTQLNPGYKDNEEMIQKLWDDLFVMSDFKLDIDSPYPVPTPLKQIVPEKIQYPDYNFKYKHYGKIIEGLIESARKMENPEEKKELTGIIANLMKRSYLSYNRDSVNEDMIIDQLKDLSNGELELDPDFKFQHTNEILSKHRKQNNNKSGKGRSKRKWKKN